MNTYTIDNLFLTWVGKENNNMYIIDPMFSIFFAVNEASLLHIQDIFPIMTRDIIEDVFFLFIEGYFWSGALLSNKTVLGFPSKEEALAYRNEHFDGWLKNRFLLHRWSQL